MASPRGITLYHSPASRAFTAYWMLEELGVPFSVKTVDIRKGEQKAQQGPPGGHFFRGRNPAARSFAWPALLKTLLTNLRATALWVLLETMQIPYWTFG